VEHLDHRLNLTTATNQDAERVTGHGKNAPAPWGEEATRGEVIDHPVQQGRWIAHSWPFSGS
jgi:hypothetical protein